MKVLIATILVLLVAGCSTSYQKKSFTGGYSETQLGENTFQVYFSGNGYTSREKTTDFTLMRSAELTLENGFEYFIIVDSAQSSNLSSYTTPTRSHTSGHVGPYGNFDARTTTYGGQTYLIKKPQTTNTIVCFKEKPDISGIIYDAKFIFNSISQKYGIEPPSSPEITPPSLN